MLAGTSIEDAAMAGSAIACTTCPAVAITPPTTGDASAAGRWAAGTNGPTRTWALVAPEPRTGPAYGGFALVVGAAVDVDGAKEGADIAGGDSGARSAARRTQDAGANRNLRVSGRRNWTTVNRCAIL